MINCLSPSVPTSSHRTPLFLITKNWSLLFPLTNHWSPLSLMTNHWSSMFLKHCYWSPMFSLTNHWSPMFLMINHWSSLFSTSNHSTPLFPRIPQSLSHFVSKAQPVILIFSPSIQPCTNLNVNVYNWVNLSKDPLSEYLRIFNSRVNFLPFVLKKAEDSLSSPT